MCQLCIEIIVRNKQHATLLIKSINNKTKTNKNKIKNKQNKKNRIKILTELNLTLNKMYYPACFLAITPLPI